MDTIERTGGYWPDDTYRGLGVEVPRGAAERGNVSRPPEITSPQLIPAAGCDGLSTPVTRRCRLEAAHEIIGAGDAL